MDENGLVVKGAGSGFQTPFKNWTKNSKDQMVKKSWSFYYKEMASLYLK
jgi:hypothetical protein